MEIARPMLIRDFSDVRDVVRAYRVIAERGLAGATYNVASGNGVAISWLADRIAEIVGIAPALASPTSHALDEPSVLIGNTARLRALGWEPRIGLEQTLADVVAHYTQGAG
jgi:GDP-4-dehydro-6-deoxy-D-mannose reductase